MILHLLLLPSALAQDGFDAHGLHIVALDGDLRDPLLINRPAGIFANDWHFSGLLEYADSPLVRTTQAPDGTTSEEAVIASLMALNLSGGWAPTDWLRLDLTAPLYLTSTGTASQGASAGDLRVSAVFAPLQPRDNGGIGLGLVPFLVVPTGSSAAFLGQQGLTGGASAVATAELSDLTLSGEVAMLFQPAVELDNLNGSDAIALGGGAGWRFSDRFGATLEARAQLPFLASTVEGTGTPAEAILSGRYRTRNGGFLTAGGASALSGGAGAAAWRVFLGGGFGHVQNTAPVDTDGDGLMDDVDSCVRDPETVNGYNDTDGCADTLPVLTVRAMRGEKVVKDAAILIDAGSGAERFPSGVQRPYAPGQALSISATDGPCWIGAGTTTTTESDATFDVMLVRKEANVAIEVVNEQGQRLSNAEIRWERDGSGCLPEKDGTLADGTGTVVSGIGKHTLFASAPEYGTVSATVELTEGETETVRLVLKSAKAVVETKQIKILEIVYFDTAQATILPASYPLLDEVANILRAHPEAGRVEIAGHTDADADDAYNLDLSQRRAEAVRAYLIEKGVAAERLIAKGYGESKPLVPNTSDANKAKNRRVEFNLIDQQPANLPANAIETNR